MTCKYLLVCPEAGRLQTGCCSFLLFASYLCCQIHTFAGEYALPGSFESKKVGGHSRTLSLNEALLKSLGGPTATTVAPSIPTKYQSYGYECNADGRLSLQDPLYPVYSGKLHDAVGPCEYDPKIDVRYKSAPKTSFGKV